MDLVLASNHFTSKEICTINYCRMFLQVVTISDLCLADGVSIDPAFLSGTPAPTSSTSKWLHINQGRPSEPCWQLWRHACSLWSHKNQLHFPLGTWLLPGDRLRQSWPYYYYDRDQGDLFVRQESGYLRCVTSDAVRFSPISHIDWHPTSTSIPVHARWTIQGNEWIPLIPYPVANPTPPVTTSTSRIMSL
jgi:hypothetical protein